VAERQMAERDSYLLGGRRVLISDLLDAGLLKVGDALVFARRRLGVLHNASVREDGKVQLEDGRSFNSPSRAAGAAAGGSYDGWHAWQVVATGESLDTLRQRLLDDAASVPGHDEPSDGHSSRHEFLKDARQQASDGSPITLPVRELIAGWNARGRGQVISERITADLENHGLATRPNFLKVGLDSLVTIDLRAPEEAPLGPAENGQAEDGSLPADVGLTLGNIPSANTGVGSVTPQASFEEAITQMLLNDYSQLAVMTGPRSLKGAVTWQSIARERHANRDATLTDAIVSANVLQFDTELIDVLSILQDRDFVFVRDSTNLITGIVTTADVVYAYGQLATPFILIGELDVLLRRVVSENFPLDNVRQLCDDNGSRDLKSYDDLSIGDYERVLQKPENWASLQWPLDRLAFVSRLAELRSIRNDVMHFNPDPAPEGVVGQIRNMIRLLKKYG
jgi:hypothetical protein